MNAAQLTITEVDVLLAGLAAVTEPIDIDFLWRPQLRDPGDEIVLEAAVNGRADWLITFNTRHLATAAHRFGIRCDRPGPVLQQYPEFRA